MGEYKFDYSVEKIEGKYKSMVDVPVLMLFFNRPTLLRQVFDKVREAKPSVLLLYQDGKRDNKENDEFLVAECRKIVEEIDWQCTVYKMYQTKNYGCDPSGYMSRKWAFEIVDKCIVLEDDVVPSVSFFKFCKEMLDKYEDDKRICRICGYNVLGEYNPYDSDYFFTKGGSIWGFALWKRVFDEWDTEYKFLNDPKVVECYKYTYKDAAVPCKTFLKTCDWHSKSGKEYFESIYSSQRYLSSGLSVMPSKNMISNIGIAEETTHGANNIKLLRKRTQELFFSKTHELEFPLKSPKYVLEDKRYEDLQADKMGWKNGPIKRFFGKVERLFRIIFYKYILKG